MLKTIMILTKFVLWEDDQSIRNGWFFGGWDHEDVSDWIQRFTMAKNVQYLNIVKIFKVKN